MLRGSTADGHKLEVRSSQGRLPEDGGLASNQTLGALKGHVCLGPPGGRKLMEGVCEVVPGNQQEPWGGVHQLLQGADPRGSRQAN